MCLCIAASVEAIGCLRSEVKECDGCSPDPPCVVPFSFWTSGDCWMIKRQTVHHWFESTFHVTHSKLFKRIQSADISLQVKCCTKLREQIGCCWERSFVCGLSVVSLTCIAVCCCSNKIWHISGNVSVFHLINITVVKCFPASEKASLYWKISIDEHCFLFGLGPSFKSSV